MKFLKVFFPILLLAGLALAQTTGSIEGLALDNNKQPLPGVTIEITSAALQGVRTVTTDVNGKFAFKILPVGEYKLTAKMQGFANLEQSNIQVGLDQTVTLQVNMQPAFEEKITITGESPVVDVTNTTMGSNFTKDLIDDLPSGRSYQAVAFLAAGSVNGGLDNNNPSIMGASAAENKYIVDGMDTTDPGYGVSGTNVTYNFVQEIEVKTGGYEAEYGGALGGVVNVVTKQGSNEFHTDIFGYFTNSDLTTEGKTIPNPKNSSLKSFETYDYGIDVGGKIIEDKLWYFVALNPTHHKEDRTIDILRMASDNSLVQTNNPEPEQNATYVATKLNFQMDPSNSFVATVIGDPQKNKTDYETAFYVDSPNTGIDPTTGDPAQTNKYYKDSKQGSWNYGLTYNSVLTPSLMLELKASKYDYKEKYLSQWDYTSWQDSTGAGDYSNGIGNGINFGGPGFQEPRADRSRDQFKASLSWFLGNHELKFGAQYYKLAFDYVANDSGPSGEHCVPLAPGAYQFDPATGTYPTITPNCDTNGDGVMDGMMVPNYPGNRYLLYDGYYYNRNYKNNSAGHTTEYSLFLQDAWKITPHLTLNIGLRGDDSSAKGDLTNQYAGRKMDLNFSDQLAPRIGLVWDFAQNGRSKAYVHYGKFYESIPLDVDVRAFGNERYTFLFYYYPDNGMLPTTANTGQLWYYIPAGVGTLVDPKLKGQYTEEYVAGTEYEVMPNLAVGVKGIYRDLGRVIEDVSVTGGNTYFITNPGGCFTKDPVTGNPIVDTSGNPMTVCFPKAERLYRAAELTLHKRFANNWQLYSSLLWSKNYGNYGGTFRQDNGQLDPNITSAYDLPQLLINARGLLPNDHEWQFKTYGSYRFPFGLVTGLDAEWMTGAPISKLGAHLTYGRRERFVNPRGSDGTTPDLWWLNLHFEQPFKMGGAMQISAIADIFNLTNQQQATAVDNEWTTLKKGYNTTTNPLDWVDPNEANPNYWNKLSGAACSYWLNVDPTQYPDYKIRYAYCSHWNPYWGSATAYQDPRSFRIGFKLAF